MRRARGGGVLPTVCLLLALCWPAQAVCPPCPPPPAACSLADGPTGEECLYTVDGAGEKMVISSTDTYFGIKCPDNVTLDSDSIPRFDKLTNVLKVAVIRCAPPAEPYARLLRRLNVNAPERLVLLLQPAAELRADHFAELPGLRRLYVQAADLSRPLRATPDLLKPLTSLADLWLFGVNLTSSTPLFLPPSLVILNLREVGLRELPNVTLASLTRLRHLVLVDHELRVPPEPAAAPKLSSLTLSARSLSSAPPPAGLQYLTLESVENVRLPGECGALLQLTVRGARPRALPPHWLAACRQLVNVTLSLPFLTLLPETTFANASTLRRLSLTGSKRLGALPSNLFNDMRLLEFLDLSRNNITMLPSGLFSRLERLRYLDLSSNLLRSTGAGSADAGLQPLWALTQLQHLDLRGNPLGDLCSPPPPGAVVRTGRSMSPLYPLGELRRVSLAGTGAARVCADWARELTRLVHLDLSDNRITTLEWSDMQWERAEGQTAHVSLAGNPLSTLLLQKREYERARPGPITVEFILDGTRPLQCDCKTYWFARAKKERLLRASFSELTCIQPWTGARAAPIERLDPIDMVCLSKENCPAGCVCAFRAHDESMAVRCAGLTALPDLAGLSAFEPISAIVLNASDNNISRLPAALPARLHQLDLRRNRISAVDAGAVAVLLADARTVLLAGNPLDCACSAPLLRELRLHLDQVADLDAVSCADERPLRVALTDVCPGVRAAVWAVAGAGAALLLAAIVTLMLRRHVRLRLKAFLLARGLCLRWARPDDTDDCKYDAFLSFSHLDEDVADQLVAELESGPRPLKLCVHHRDWRAGDWIPAQIALSVAESRRTVVLLSENFMRSSWARAEFREAHARALRDSSVRLIVVVLGAAPPPGLDPELQHYVDNNTYVRWGEPAFWEKLRVALPPGRPRRRPARPPPPPPRPPAAAASPRPTEQHNSRRAARAPRPPPLRTDAPRVHPAPPAPPAPPTPVVKFAQLELPAPHKPANKETSPCA